MTPQLLIKGIERLTAAPRGAKQAVISDLAREWGCSPSRVREHLKAGGWASGRARRADAGSSDLITEAELEAMATWFMVSQRKNGKWLGCVQTGKAHLYRSGLISPAAAQASDATWCRLLRAKGLSKRHLKAPSLATEIDARHPNHVHEVDASTAILFYLDGKGRVRVQRYDLADARNKPQAWARHVTTRLLLIRWALVDVYSGATFVTYRQASGENAADLVEILHEAWSRKEDPRYPLCGVPEILYADQGSPQKSSYVESLTTALSVRLILHASSHERDDAPAARATGSVEAAMRVWEAAFESQWAYAPPKGGIDEVNAQAADFLPRFNSDPRYRLSRAKATRSELWNDITEAQLRLPPNLEMFRALAVGAPLTRKLDAYGRVQIDRALYKVAHCDLWIRGQDVQIHRNPFDTDVVTVSDPATGETREAHRLERRRNGKTSAVTFVGGDRPGERPEGTPSARQPLHRAARLKREVGQDVRGRTGVAAPDRYTTELGHHSEADGLKNVAFLPRQGRPALDMEAPGRLDDLDVQQMGVARLGRPLSSEEAAWISETMGARRLTDAAAITLLEELAERAGQARQVINLRGRA